MMNKNVCFLLFLIIGLSSCSSYYYSILDSDDWEGYKNRQGDFVQENDSVRISYSFSGEDAPVYIAVYNKTDVPLFVDWTRSGIIIDDVATSYHSGTATIQGSTESSSYGGSYQWNERNSSSSGESRGTFSGEFSLPAGISFIPPKSKVENHPLTLANFPFDKIPNERYEKGKFLTELSNEVTVRTINYTEEDSPLYFRSYLTVYTEDKPGNPYRPMYFERSFYISKLIKTGNVEPANFKAGQSKSGDFFYVRKVRGANTGIIVGVVALSVAGVVIEASVPGHY